MKRLPFGFVLAISAHADDMELACGGTIHRLVRGNADVFMAVFSHCEESLPEEYRGTDPMAGEVMQSVQELGMEYGHVLEHLFPVRRFSEHRQDILECLYRMNEEMSPDLVLVPGGRHQDHQVIREEAFRAFRRSTIWAGEMIGDPAPITKPGFVALSEADVQGKVNATGCYVSQRHRPYMAPDLIWSWAVLRGRYVDREYAEMVEVVQQVF